MRKNVLNTEQKCFVRMNKDKCDYIKMTFSKVAAFKFII